MHSARDPMAVKVPGGKFKGQLPYRAISQNRRHPDPIGEAVRRAKYGTARGRRKTLLLACNVNAHNEIAWWSRKLSKMTNGNICMKQETGKKRGCTPKILR